MADDEPPLKYDMDSIWKLVKDAAAAWVEDRASTMGASLAYYTVFSIAPLLLIVIAVAGLVFGAEAARGEILVQLRGLMGDDAAHAIQGLLESARKPEESAFATAVGVVVLLVGATTVFGELQDTLDHIWRAPARDKSSGLWGLVRARFLSFGMILCIGFLLIVSLIFNSVISALGKHWNSVFGEWELLAQVVNFVVGLVLTTAVFAMIYKIMPRVQIRWRDVWVGAGVTSLLFTIGKSLIGLYIGKTGVASGFGAAGSLVVILVWVYYSAQIFLLGAEFTWAYAHTYGSRQGIDRNAPVAPVEASPPAPVPPSETPPLEGSLPARAAVTAAAIAAAAAATAVAGKTRPPPPDA